MSCRPRCRVVIVALLCILHYNSVLLYWISGINGRRKVKWHRAQRRNGRTIIPAFFACNPAEAGGRYGRIGNVAQTTYFTLLDIWGIWAIHVQWQNGRAAPTLLACCLSKRVYLHHLCDLWYNLCIFPHYGTLCPCVPKATFAHQLQTALQKSHKMRWNLTTSHNCRGTQSAQVPRTPEERPQNEAHVSQGACSFFLLWWFFGCVILLILLGLGGGMCHIHSAAGALEKSTIVIAPFVQHWPTHPSTETANRNVSRYL